MQKYKTMLDFPSQEGVMPILSAVITAIPPFWSVVLFVLWITGTATSYFAILKSTGKKRFWHSLTAMSFVCFLLSLVIVGMNTTALIHLSGYWVGFYILTVLGSWFMLAHYK